MSSDFLDSSRLNCMRHTCRPAEAKSIPVLAHCSYIGFRSGWVSYPMFNNGRGGASVLQLWMRFTYSLSLMVDLRINEAHKIGAVRNRTYRGGKVSIYF